MTSGFSLQKFNFDSATTILVVSSRQRNPGVWVKRLCISHTSYVVVLRGCKYDDNFHRYQIGIHPRPSLFTQGCNIVLVFKTHTHTHTQSRQTRMKKYHSFTLKQQQLLIIKPTLRRLPYLSILNRNRYYVALKLS